METPMKIGFVGCGGFCCGTHIPNARRNPLFDIVAFCDLDPSRLDELKRQYQPQYVTTDMTRIFRDPQIEMVICATKPDVRMPVMELAVKHRKHLFVEKPLCHTRAAIGPMVDLMRDAPICFMVGFNRPYSPMMQSLKPLYQAHARGHTLITYRIIGEARLWPKHHRDAILVRGESTIIHEVTHIFDLLNWLTARRPIRVYTAGAGNTDNIITLSYPDNITAVIIAGDNATAGYPKERIEIDASYGTMIGEEFIELRAIGLTPEPIHRTFPFTQEGRTYDTGLPDAIARYGQWRASITEAEKASGYYYDRQVKPDKGHYGELEHFRQCIRQNRPPDTGMVQGALANLIAESALESRAKGLPVELTFPESF